MESLKKTTFSGKIQWKKNQLSNFPVISSSIFWILQTWLVVEPYPSEKWWTSSIGMMRFPIYDGKNNLIQMFQTTNQIIIKFPLLLVYTLLTTINITINITMFQSPTRDFPTFQSSKFPSRWPNRMKKSCGGGGTSRVAAAAAEATIMATGSWRNHERNHVVCIYHLVITINGWDYGWIILIIICDISIINSNNPECHPLVGYTPHLYGFVWK